MIGIIDSGMGGLTTLAALVRHQCDRAFCYYADVAHAPYGNQSSGDIIDAVRHAAECLLARGCRRIVLACNTATAAALRYLSRSIPTQVYGLTPAVDEALAAGGTTLLAATRYTASRRCREDLRTVALPDLATLVDRHYPHLDDIEDYCRRHLSPYAPVDNLVLGCTHYVLVRDVLARAVGARRTFDANDALARRIGATHEGSGLCVDVVASGDIDEQRYAQVLQSLLQNAAPSE